MNNLQGVNKDVVVNPFLKRIIEGEDEIEVLKEAVEEYIFSTGWADCGYKLGINQHTLRTFVVKRENLLKEKAADVYKLYLKKTGRSRLEELNNEVMGEAMKLTMDVFASLPKKISYYDFLNIMCKYRTDKSGNALVAIANKYGIDVVG